MAARPADGPIGPGEAFLREVHDQDPGGTPTTFGHYRTARGSSSYQALAAEVAGAARILDLACGDGFLAETLGTAPGSATVVGLDLSAAELRAARRRLGAGVPLAQARAQRLPLPDASVDAVASHMALMLMDPVEPVLAECRRVLRPGGRLAAVVGGGPRRRDLLALFVAELRREWARGAPSIPPLGDRRVRDAGALRTLLEDAGFDQVRIREMPVTRRGSPEACFPDFANMYDGLVLSPESLGRIRSRVLARARRRGLRGARFPLRVVTARRS